ncbi:MAG: tRNA preQ1(34) S-adenosylmethionine ribosyltransferase-isomerase QueA, partial [Firmicutes bacterium]|nr:tRNA preQ1(34) S-adenosylmethionine ribosyltransferase-isomerase QueA [Bacillota bacterium]
MKKSDFRFDLPERLIAQEPLADRAASRLMILDRKTGAVRHSRFRDIAAEFRRGDCLVINDTKVIPARLRGYKKTGGRVELLLLRKLGANRWETLARPGRIVRPGDEIFFGDGLLTAEIAGRADGGNRVVEFRFDGLFEDVLEKLGEAPLPPYIKRALADKNRYQTVYAAREGSAAAPTAGLHFTEELLGEVSAMGVAIARLTLHVGLGTFRPVRAENIDEHVMHEEEFSVAPDQAEIINGARRSGGRVIAVGTTSVRTLESCAREDGVVEAKSGSTGIFITPGYRFRAVDAIITNFHVPESTLIMLVSAFAGRENVLRAYGEAIREEYRFFSFGDAML